MEKYYLTWSYQQWTISMKETRGWQKEQNPTPNLYFMVRAAAGVNIESGEILLDRIAHPFSDLYGMKVKVWTWKFESESVKNWKLKCENIKWGNIARPHRSSFFWSLWYESESVNMKVWKWKCEKLKVKVWKYKVGKYCSTASLILFLISMVLVNPSSIQRVSGVQWSS